MALSLVNIAEYSLRYIKFSGFRCSTQEVIHNLVTTCGHNPNRQNKVRFVLYALESGGYLQKFGHGKHDWKWTGKEWSNWDIWKDCTVDPRGPTYTSKKMPGEKRVPISHVPEPVEIPAPTKDQVMVLMSEVMEDQATFAVNNIQEDAATILQESITKAVEDTRAALIKAGMIEVVHKIQINEDPKPVIIKGAIHPALPRVLKLIAGRRNIMLIGPAGCGKSFLCKQLAMSLKLPFSHVSCTSGMSEGHILGRLLPNAKGGFEYQRSDTVKAYEEGGVHLFDEWDAADSNTVLVLNSAFANGTMWIPNRHSNPYAKKHKNAHLLAAVNTYGTGADRMYVGRNQMDESTLDRFRIGQIEMDYDMGKLIVDKEYTPPVIDSGFVAEMNGLDGIETKLCPDADIRITLQWYRAQARRGGVRRIISTRFIEDAYIMSQVKPVGFTMQDIEMALFAGWSKDELRKVGRSDY